MSTATVTIDISDDDDDGICIATVKQDSVEIEKFETTQAEMKVMALRIGGYAIPKNLAEEADAAETRRIELGRTLVTEIIDLGTHTVTELQETAP